MRWTRWILVLFVAFALLLGWLSFPPRWPKAEPLPTLTASFEKRCDVTRDRWDVPHIQATSQEAASYCWGHMQALDRGWQLDYLRRLAYGRVSEAYGSQHIVMDFTLRMMDFQRISSVWLKTLPQQEPRIHRLLQFFAWGINDGFRKLRNHPKRPYLWSRNYNPPPWRIQDTLVIILLQSFYQTRRTFTDDIQQTRLRLQLGEKRYRELYGDDKDLRPWDFSIIKPGEHKLVPKRHTALPLYPSHPQTLSSPQPESLQERQTKLATLAQWQRWLGPLQDTRGEGSNNWVVAASRSQSGHAMLANDPHLAISTPSFWYEVHIQAPNLNVLGVGVPGTPALVSGHNETLAWGITNGYSNTGDIVRIRPKQGTFQLENKTYKIESYRPWVWFKIWGIHVPIFFKSFERTALGPIIPLPWENDEKLLLRWTGFHMTEAPIKPGMLLMAAKRVDEANKIYQQWQLPCWNFVFADQQGNIGYRQVGLVARRKQGIYGFIDARDPAQRWQGFLKPDEMAFLLNPQRGYIATANNRTFPAHYPLFLGHTFIKGYRAQRIEQQLQAKAKLSLQDMQAIQLDAQVPGAVLLLDTMLQQIQQQKGSLSPLAQKAIPVLQGWNKQADREQIAPTLFRAWVWFLADAMFELDSQSNMALPKNIKPIEVWPGYEAMKRVLLGTLKPGSTKSVSVLLRSALEGAVQQLSAHLGPDMAKWYWKRYHLHKFHHQGGKHLTTRPPSQGASGDEHTVNLGESRGNGPYEVVSGPSYRFVVEMGPKIRAYGVLAGKNIDQAPQQLGTQQKLWLHGQYRPRPFYPEDIKKYQKSKTTLQW